MTNLFAQDLVVEKPGDLILNCMLGRKIMKKKAIKQQIKRRKVKFSIDAPGASQVILMGDSTIGIPKRTP